MWITNGTILLTLAASKEVETIERTLQHSLGGNSKQKNYNGETQYSSMT